MTERRPHPRRHRAILRFAAGLAVSATLVGTSLPSLAESSRKATATPEVQVEESREASVKATSEATGRQQRGGRPAVAIAAPPGRSVRPRGEAAPVRLGPTATASATLLLPAPTSTPAPREPGQAPLNQPLGSERRYAIPKKPEIDTGSRLWPMREGTYTFSQEFGCVQQISGFYPAVAGCPPDRPVVHSGLDFAAESGTLIYAAASGWVTEAGLDRDTGLANTRLVIQHEGRNRDYATEYLHWISTFVKPGDYVRAGEPIAEVGSVGYSTGPHLHFGVIDFGTGDYIDPRSWLPGDASDGDYREARRERPRTRFADRSAGLPDYHDPAPAPAPTRQPVPDGSGADRAGASDGKASGEDRARERRQRRAERRDRLRASDGRPSEAAATATPEPTSGKDRVRRDRTRDGETSQQPDAGADHTRERERKPGSGKSDGGAKRDDERGDGKQDGKDRTRDARSEDAGDIAAIPEATVTGALPDADAPPTEATPTPVTGDPEREPRPGKAR